MRAVLVVACVGCGGAAAVSSQSTLRSACGADQYWDGKSCTHGGDAPAKLVAGVQALHDNKFDEAGADFEAAALSGPLDHKSHVLLWEQRGILAAYIDDMTGAASDFDMLLALDPGHLLSYDLSLKATRVFERVRTQAERGAPEIDVTWDRSRRVGDTLPVDLEVLADPHKLLHHATLFVRTRGESSWHAADLALNAPGNHRVVLPPVTAARNVSLELYATAYDAKDNEIVLWADPARPREIPLHYVAPTPWYKTWWGITAIVVAAGAATAVTAYELTVPPPDKIGASASVK